MKRKSFSARSFHGLGELPTSEETEGDAAVADQFNPRIRMWKVEVLHNGFPVEEFTPVGKLRVEAFRRTFNLTGSVLIGVVGRIKFGRKGQDVFLRAANLLKDRFPSVRFVFIGSPFPGNEEHLEMLMALTV